MAAARTLLDRLQDRRVGVVLSAGYFGFYAHAGFLLALEDVGLPVDSFAGSSAGALVAAMAASGMKAGPIADRLCGLRREEFWDADPLGAARGAVGGLGATGLLRGEKMRALLARELPAKTFEECPTRLLTVATNLTRGAAQGFTRGELAPRVQASCAYPGLFRAAEIEGEHFWDGGLVDKAPALALHEAFRPQVLLVHYLPTRAGRGQPGGPFAYARAMAGAISALRRDHFDLQVELLRRSNVPVAVVSSQLPPIGPRTLAQGRAVVEQARRMAVEALRSAAPVNPAPPEQAR
jgi:NTE family protein